MYLEIDAHLVIQIDDKVSAFSFSFITNVYTILLNFKNYNDSLKQTNEFGPGFSWVDSLPGKKNLVSSCWALLLSQRNNFPSISSNLFH